MKTTIGIATLVLLSAITVAFSDGDKHDASTQRELGKYLQLSPSQQTAWDRAHDEYRNATRALTDKRTALGTQGEAAIKQRSPDACAIGRIMISMQSIGDQLRGEETAFQQKVTSLMSAEQRTKYDAFRAGQDLVK